MVRAQEEREHEREKKKGGEKKRGRRGKRKKRRWKGIFTKPEKGERVAAKRQGVGKENCQGETLGFGG